MYAKEDKRIDRDLLTTFFKTVREAISASISEGCWMRRVPYMTTQCCRKSRNRSIFTLHNEGQISDDIRNDHFALNFEIGAIEICRFTGKRVGITEAFLDGIERHLLDETADKTRKAAFRNDTEKECAYKTLTHEIILEGQPLARTSLCQSLHERYVHNFKAKDVEPFQEKENFRRLVKDYGEKDVKVYEKKIRDNVSYLIKTPFSKGDTQRRGPKRSAYT